MSAKKYKREVYSYDMVGVVEETNDPKRLGRVKVRIERLHGRVDDQNFIPTEDLPWCDVSLRGRVFDYPGVGKVVTVSFENDDIYKPTVTGVLHYNINLQEKLQSLNDEQYAEFYAHHFNAKHQYFHDKDEGIVFDYVKSNINMRTNGDIHLNLRDNNSFLFLGTENASQQAVLGNHFFDWFDDFIQNLLGSKGGPYFGNMGAPVLPNPALLQNLNEYLALKETFLSDHVYIVDDRSVVEQDREYDIEQVGDNYNNENFDRVNNPQTTGYQPEPAPVSGGNPANCNVPPTNFSDNLTSSKIPDDATPEEKLREIKPFEDEVGNGEIPTENMTISKRLSAVFPTDNDERKFLLDESAKSLDSWLDFYDAEKKEDWSDIIVTKGYQNTERQDNTRKRYPLKAPLTGKDPFGFGNQVELFFGVDKNDKNTTDRIKQYLRRGNIDENLERLPEEESLDWLINNGRKYKWRLVGRTSAGGQQWWHWIYDATLTETPPVINEPVPVNAPVNPIEVNKKTFGSNDNFSSDSIKSIKATLNEKDGKWKYVGLEYDYSSDDESAVRQQYNDGIKSNGKFIEVNMEFFIENELDLTLGDFANGLKVKFKLTADPIMGNGKLDTNRNQKVEFVEVIVMVK